MRHPAQKICTRGHPPKKRKLHVVSGGRYLAVEKTVNVAKKASDAQDLTIMKQNAKGNSKR